MQVVERLGIDLKRLVSDAEAAGFNPLTIVRGGGLAGYVMSSQPVSTPGYVEPPANPAPPPPPITGGEGVVSEPAVVDAPTPQEIERGGTDPEAPTYSDFEAYAKSLGYDVSTNDWYKSVVGMFDPYANHGSVHEGTFESQFTREYINRVPIAKTASKSVSKSGASKAAGSSYAAPAKVSVAAAINGKPAALSPPPVAGVVGNTKSPGGSGAVKPPKGPKVKRPDSILGVTFAGIEWQPNPWFSDAEHYENRYGELGGAVMGIANMVGDVVWTGALAASAWGKASASATPSSKNEPAPWYHSFPGSDDYWVSHDEGGTWQRLPQW